MTTNVTKDLKLPEQSTLAQEPNKTLKTGSGTAKLLINPDGTVCLQGNSNFPTSDCQEKQKIFAACSTDGQTNVYYSPSGNPSEVYLLKPTAKSAGKQLVATNNSVQIQQKAVSVSATDSMTKPLAKSGDVSQPIIISAYGKDTPLKSKQTSLLATARSRLQEKLSSKPLLTQVSLSQQTSDTDSSPNDDLDFPIDLPVTFGGPIEDTNSSQDELYGIDSTIPDIGSTIAAHLHSKEKEPVVPTSKTVRAQLPHTQKNTPQILLKTTSSNGAGGIMSISKTLPTPTYLKSPTSTSQAQIILLPPSGTTKQPCIYYQTANTLLTSILPVNSTKPLSVPVNKLNFLNAPIATTNIATSPATVIPSSVSFLKSALAAVNKSNAPKIIQTSNISSAAMVPLAESEKQTKNTSTLVVYPAKTSTMTAQSGSLPSAKNGNHCTSATTTTTFCNLNLETSIPVKSKIPSTLQTLSSNGGSARLPEMIANGSQFTPLITSQTINSHNQNNNAVNEESEDSQFTIRIDSVFSLSDTKQTDLEQDDKIKRELKRKKKRNRSKKHKFVRIFKEVQCKPLYVVLDRLSSETGPFNILSNTPKTKCTEYCRQRTLNCLCKIGLLDCKNPELNVKVTHVQRKRVEIDPNDSSEGNYKQESATDTSISKSDDTNPVPSKIARLTGDSDVKARITCDSKKVDEREIGSITTVDPKSRNLLIDHLKYISTQVNDSQHKKNSSKQIVATTEKPKSSAELPRSTSQESQPKTNKSGFNTNTATKSLVPNQKTFIKLPTMITPTNASTTTPATKTNATATKSNTTSTKINTTATKSDNAAQANSFGNGKFYLLKINGKSVLIPTDQTLQNKAFVLNQSPKGITTLTPASLTYNKPNNAIPVTVTANSLPNNTTTNALLNTAGVAELGKTTKVTNTPPITINTSSVVPSINHAKPVTVTLSASTTVTSSSNQVNSIPTTQNHDTTKKRKKTLAERYPLPPGVVIKQEPRTTGYGDEPKEKVYPSQQPQIRQAQIPSSVQTTLFTIPPPQAVRAQNPVPVYSTTQAPIRLVQQQITSLFAPKHTTNPASNVLTMTNAPNITSLIRNVAPSQTVRLTNPGQTTQNRAINTTLSGSKQTITVPLIRPANSNQCNVQLTSQAASLLNTQPARSSSITLQIVNKTGTAAKSLVNNNMVTLVKNQTTGAFCPVSKNTLVLKKTQDNTSDSADARLPIPTEQSAPVLNPQVSTSSDIVTDLDMDITSPDSPGPPDLGEPQITLSPRLTRSDSDCSMESECDSAPLTFISPVTKSNLSTSGVKPKTPQELRIEKLKEQLREQEKALDEMRRKKTQEPIELNDDD